MEYNLTDLKEVLCDLCAFTLFDKEISLPADINTSGILTEARHQTVFPIAASALKKLSIVNKTNEKLLLYNVINNVRISHNHTEIANMLTENEIKFVFIKGVASAAYYNEPDMRTMGDVDILIERSEVQKVNDLLITLGYSTDDNIFKEKGHIGYKRRVNGVTSVCEVHMRINGIPTSLAETFDKYLNNILEAVEEIEIVGGKCFVPSPFHHGIILLLHTATHWTHEGVGLRHLCDWAVFVNHFANEEFTVLFETPLKEMGIWRFAQLLTLCSVKYLGAENKEWAGVAEEGYLKDMITDIISGGNFGFKDKDRYSQIKYISNRDSKKVSTKNTFVQAALSVNAKAKAKYKFAGKYKLLLPFGWIAVIFDYFILVLKGKRKPDNINTINAAKKRKSIYKEFKLFDIGE